ncbi:cell division protein FtsQ/DivIB [Edaphobacter sp.]|uniref:cell division protein FtsQ/DivIB n=1 Tax=Edaphobacter sp. TaxID=1934404 RepID=UPI002DB87BB1|nr:FtsQ-type POTRA domain-containing protein [Edaphobacter sp.]HEU5342381.1 FtsQ-type POTRA domain-containing protein [Edaphobacter sp.]
MLEAPEREYAPEFAAPRRASVTPKRKLRGDFTEDFANDLADEDDDLPAPRRRGSVRLRFRVGMPKSRWGKVAIGLAVLVMLGACAGAAMLVRNWLMHDARFVVPSASAIEFTGNVHTTRDDLLNVFGDDIERNIFYVPLAQRRAEVEQLPWVAHATVMRLLPNHLRVSVVERTPVAFVRQGSRIGLVDANGVLLTMPPGAQGDAHYSFPVVSGIVASDPLSTRAARMQIFERFSGALDSADKGLAGISQVDLSDPEDVRALISTDSSDILVHFGADKFLERYQKFEEHLPEWRTLYPKLASVDMRYETQAVLDMQPGAAQPQSAAPAAAPVAPTVTHPAVKAAAHPATKASAKHPAVKHAPAKKSRARAVVKAKHHAVKRHSGAANYHSSQAVHR